MQIIIYHFWPTYSNQFLTLFCLQKKRSKSSWPSEVDSSSLFFAGVDGMTLLYAICKHKDIVGLLFHENQIYKFPSIVSHNISIV